MNRKDFMKDNYPSEERIITNDTIIKWTKDVFKATNVDQPKVVFVFNAETAKMFIDHGMPPENIRLMKPLKRSRNFKKK